MEHIALVVVPGRDQDRCVYTELSSHTVGLEALTR